ncbi:MAG: hypothetical protein ABR977_12880 [Candidatus Dormibacteria bacterium]|jgi:hypothetical protein
MSTRLVLPHLPTTASGLRRVFLTGRHGATDGDGIPHLAALPTGGS